MPGRMQVNCIDSNCQTTGVVVNFGATIALYFVQLALFAVVGLVVWSAFVVVVVDGDAAVVL